MLMFTLSTSVQANSLSEHEQSIQRLVGLSIMKGNEKGELNQDGQLTRGQFALMLSRWLGLSIDAPSNQFTDLPNDPELRRAVNVLSSQGIISGYEDKTYRPSQPIKREHLATLIDRTLQSKGIQIEMTQPNYLDDSKIGKEHKFAVYRMSRAGIIQGSTLKEGIYFNPMNYATRGQAATVFARTIDFVNQELEKPAAPLKEKYSIARLQGGNLVFSEMKYDSYASASANLKTSDLGIGFIGIGIDKEKNKYYLDERLIFSTQDAVAFSPFNNEVTTIYNSKNFTKQLAYIQAGREMKLLEQGEHYYKVQVADTVGYTKRSQTGIIPKSMLKHQEHYKVNANGSLVHSYYNHLRNKSESYEVGPAPAAMKKGVNYYSMDGIRFYSDTNHQKLVTTHYPYFQYLNIRSKTSYTADELEEMILSELKRIEYTTNPNALKDSKLVGLGQHIKKMETDYSVNALFILATAIHESAYGLSNNAKNINNLFGIRVTDQNTAGGTKYAHPRDSVTAFVLDYMNKNYAHPGGLYAKGASPGNKTMGANVHYASDMTWGAKIGSHMWRLDKKMGSKDIYKEKRGVVYSITGINVRKTPSTSAPILFRFNEKYTGLSGKSGYPVIILSQEKQPDGYIWYEIIADSIQNQELTGWVRGDLLEKID